MATITEDYVSFETAKLLKEKGFNEDCLKYYIEGRKYIRDLSDEDWPYRLKNSKAKENVVTVPTLQMAMKWLREVHDLNINNELSIYGYFCSISLIVRDSLGYIVDVEDSESWETVYYDTYEEACEAAIKFCLENLI